jgi:hypothetical protein
MMKNDAITEELANACECDRIDEADPTFGRQIELIRSPYARRNESHDCVHNAQTSREMIAGSSIHRPRRDVEDHDIAV